MSSLNYGTALVEITEAGARVTVRRVKNDVVDGYVVDVSGDLPGPAIRLAFPHVYSESDTGWTLTWGVPLSELPNADVRFAYASLAARGNIR